jgi:hypothetical protein
LEEPLFHKLIILSASVLLAIPASAGIIAFSLDQSTIDTLPGGIGNPSNCAFTVSCVIFTGTISFTSDQYYSINDISIDIPDGGSFVTGNDLYFQDNVAGVLGGDGTPDDTLSPCGDNDSCYVGGLFEIDVASDAPLGIYAGTATLEASDQNSNPITGSATVVDFQVDVVPEPGMGALTLLGLVSLAAMGRRFRRK